MGAKAPILKTKGNDVIYKIANWLDGKIDWSSTNIKEFVYIGLNF